MPKAAHRATEVNLGRIPRWIEGILRKESPFARLRKNPQDERRAIISLLSGLELDHWGTTNWQGVKNCFVTEPYGVKTEYIELLREKGRRFGFAVVHDKLSYHNPNGGCERVLLFPTDLPKLVKYPKEVLKALESAGCLVSDGQLLPPELVYVNRRTIDKKEFERDIHDTQFGTFNFFDRPCSVEKIAESHYLFHCLSENEMRLKKAIRAYSKMAQAFGRRPISIDTKPLMWNEMIAYDNGLCVSPDGFLVRAFEYKDIGNENVQLVENKFKSLLGSNLLRTVHSEENQYQEITIFFELKKPISAKDMNELFEVVSAFFEKKGNCGHKAFWELKRTSVLQSTSEFFQTNLEIFAQ